MAARKTAERANSAKCNTLSCHMAVNVLAKTVSIRIPRIPPKIHRIEIANGNTFFAIINLKFHTNSYYSWTFKCNQDSIIKSSLICSSSRNTIKLWRGVFLERLKRFFLHVTNLGSALIRRSEWYERTTKAGQSGVPFETCNISRSFRSRWWLMWQVPAAITETQLHAETR